VVDFGEGHGEDEGVTHRAPRGEDARTDAVDGGVAVERRATPLGDFAGALVHGQTGRGVAGDHVARGADRLHDAGRSAERRVGQLDRDGLLCR
jgi:hypothetical protein